MIRFFIKNNSMDIIGAEHLQLFGQLLLAVLLGSAVGIERTLAHQLAGFRTFAMVSLGACGFSIIAVRAYELFSSSGFNIAMMAGQVVGGAGFLAAGLIVLHKEQVHGLTTGAGLWVAAAIGLACGFGLYALALFIALLSVLIFGLFWHVEQRLVGPQQAHDIQDR